ncbi:MAG: transposase, partial [Chloroflexia bacterium]
MQRRTFSRKFKLGVVQEILAGTKRPAQACREHEIRENLHLKWRREYEQRGEEAPSARVDELERHCGRLSLELSVVKK